MLGLTFDPTALTIAQRHGSACVVCHKKWPRPRIRAGHVPCGAVVYACDECAATLTEPAPLATRIAEPAPAAHR
ncbi:MAG TPA: hypothetical protein VF069_10220 [Streptosporangiaceae bacterium]